MKQNQSEKGLAHLGLILGAIFVLVAVALGGWYVWHQNNKSDDPPIQNSDTKTQTTGQEEKNEIPPSFLLYENKEFGFSFAYPEQVGLLNPADTADNQNILLYDHSKDIKNAFASNTQSPLYVRVDKEDSFLARKGKYGPILEYDNGKWIVSGQDGGDMLNGGYPIGSEYKVSIVRSVEGIPIYDLSFSDEGCHRTVWVFKQETSFTTITLPAVCADEIDVVPQARLDSYKEVSDKVLETLKIN